MAGKGKRTGAPRRAARPRYSALFLQTAKELGVPQEAFEVLHSLRMLEGLLEPLGCDPRDAAAARVAKLRRKLSRKA